jgi:hypothetical protein
MHDLALQTTVITRRGCFFLVSAVTDTLRSINEAFWLNKLLETGDSFAMRKYGRVSFSDINLSYAMASSCILAAYVEQRELVMTLICRSRDMGGRIDFSVGIGNLGFS